MMEGPNSNLISSLFAFLYWQKVGEAYWLAQYFQKVVDHNLLHIFSFSLGHIYVSSCCRKLQKSGGERLALEIGDGNMMNNFGNSGVNNAHQFLLNIQITIDSCLCLLFYVGKTWRGALVCSVFSKSS